MSAVRVRHRPPAFAPEAIRQASHPLIARRLTNAIVGQNEHPSAALVLAADGIVKNRLQRPGLPSHRFLEFLGGAEGDLLAGLDLDRLAGRGVAAHAGGALAHLENAEAADPDAVALLEVLGHQ